METKNLQDLESRIFYEYGRDGAMETLMGAGLLLIGFDMAFNENAAVFNGIIPVFIFLLAKAWRKRITQPRLGYVAITPERRQRTKRGVLVLLFVAMCAMLLAVWSSKLIEHSSTADPASTKNLTRLLFGGMLSAIITAVARFRRVPHLYWFAGLNLVFFLLVVLNHQPSGMAIAGTGIVLFCFGIVLTVKFLKNHPVMEASADVG